MAATRFYQREMLAAEYEIAACVRRLLKSSCQKIEPLTEGLQHEQPDAVKMICESPISILFGPPGTGKTTTSNMAIRSLDKAGMNGLVLAPMAKAAKRSQEVIHNPKLPALTNDLECMTVHRGLKFSKEAGGFLQNYKNPFKLDYIFLEEAGTLDCLLAAHLFTAIDPRKTRIILLGDPYQLPSVGPGNILHDLIHSNVVPKVQLTRVMRTGENSGIAHNARRILGGELPCKDSPEGVPFKDFFYVPRTEAQKSKEFILQSVAEKIADQYKLDRLMDIQVLSPGKNSEVGTKTLNRELRAILNPGKERFGNFRAGDKVINRTNLVKDLGIVNGDVGRVIEIGDKGMTVDFGVGAGLDGNGIVEYDGKSEHFVSHLHLAYCFTVHSSQGSEFPAVLMPVHTAHWKLLYRNLIYTGMTRAKILSCLVGDIKALRHAIENSVTDKRITGLQEWLRTA